MEKVVNVIKNSYKWVVGLSLAIMCSLVFCGCGEADLSNEQINSAFVDTSTYVDSQESLFVSDANIVEASTILGSQKNFINSNAKMKINFPDEDWTTDISEGDVGGVGTYLAYNMIKSTLNTFKTLTKENDFKLENKYAGTITNGTVTLDVAVSATIKDFIISGMCNMSQQNSNKCGYFVEFDLFYNFATSKIVAFIATVFDNDIESMGQILWGLHFSQDNPTKVLKPASLTVTTSRLAKAETTGNNFYNQKANKTGYNFSTEFSSFFIR